MLKKKYIFLLLLTLFITITAVQVEFHYPPTCGRNNNWVFAHWYETGTWSGDSRGIKASGNPMEVEGQTRFYVNDELHITEFVVTRTFTEWEETLQKQ